MNNNDNTLPVCKNCGHPHSDHQQVRVRVSATAVRYDCPPPHTTQYEPQAEEPGHMAIDVHIVRVGVVVKDQKKGVEPVETGPGGAICVGAAHHEAVGPVLQLVLQDADGSMLVATMNAQGVGQVSAAINQCMRRIMAGEFDKPETMQ